MTSPDFVFVWSGGGRCLDNGGSLSEKQFSQCAPRLYSEISATEMSLTGDE